MPKSKEFVTVTSLKFQIQGSRQALNSLMEYDKFDHVSVLNIHVLNSRILASICDASVSSESKNIHTRHNHQTQRQRMYGCDTIVVTRIWISRFIKVAIIIVISCCLQSNIAILEVQNRYFEIASVF